MLFGTDGIRGTVNHYPMTAEIALRFGMAAGVYLQNKERQQSRNRAIIAKDTRLSGYLIEPALTAGLVAVGVDVTLVGPMPTPAVSMLIKSLRADLGIMVTASHNPYHDNGLKLFDQFGFKISDECESAIQNLILCNHESVHHVSFENFLATPEKLGRVMRLEDAPGRYIEYMKSSFPKNYTLSGLRIVIDCANGATYKIAPTIMWELGAEVITVGCDPTGFNINENCGTTCHGALAAKVVETRADIGLAFDGDGDRILICDEFGNIISGDHIIALIALYLRDAKLLKGDGIVVTHMSNGALKEYMESQKMRVLTTRIGDRYVAAEMRKHGYNLGGEQSGHIILSDYSTTGDGILAGLHILAALRMQQKKASELFNLFPLTPQISINVKFKSANPLEQASINENIEKIKSENKHLKILVRKSGTETTIRIMVEGKDLREIKEVAVSIKKELERLT
ncbi:phosphoglucosamine mutase [Alphaproteobacteria bacterium]